jgi:hypothetical protein
VAVVCCRVAMQGLGVDGLPLLLHPRQQAVRMRRLLLGRQLQQGVRIDWLSLADATTQSGMQHLQLVDSSDTRASE